MIKKVLRLLFISGLGLVTLTIHIGCQPTDAVTDNPDNFFDDDIETAEDDGKLLPKTGVGIAIASAGVGNGRTTITSRLQVNVHATESQTSSYADV